MKIGQLICVCIVLINSIKAQNIDEFKVLVSEGELPADINISSSEKVEEQSKQISNSTSSSEANSEKKFIVQSNYVIDKMLSSGMVLYGDKLTRYVEKVADELLKNDLELRNKLSFYIVKTPQVNAFTTDRGEIFITVGLLAQIENEAQLAFVISHELVHFINKHAKTGFVENEKIEQGKGKYERMNWNKVLSKSKYSKELELEADEQGLELYLKSNYSINEINAVFYVLQYAHLPIDDEPFSRDFFNDEYLMLPSSMEDREVTKIEAIDDEDDKYHNHPNINKRRAIIQNEIEGKSNTGKLEFINSKEDFFEVQSLSRFELSFLYAKNRYYGESIYNSYLLLKKYPDNKFLKINIGYCLYAMAKYKNDVQINKVLTDYSDVQGESQNVFYIFDKIEKKTLNVLAVKYLWDLKEEITDDKFLDIIAEDVIEEMLLKSGVRKSDFSKNFLVESNDKKDTLNLSKYDKIKSNKNETGASYEYAFINLFKNEKFIELMAKYEEEYVENVKNPKEKVEKVKDDKRGKKALGIDKVVMVSPTFRHFDFRKDITEQYEFSEKRKNEFIDYNKTIADKKGVNLTVLDEGYFSSTAQYNDMSLLNDWMDERFSHVNLEIYPYCGTYTDELINKYGTGYFIWSGTQSIKLKRKGLGWVIVLTPLFVISGLPSIYLAAIPGAIPPLIYLSKNTNRSFSYTYLVDISSYDVLLVKEDFRKSKARTDLMKISLNNTYYQIGSKKK